jgi:hypothetical protein
MTIPTKRRGITIKGFSGLLFWVLLLAAEQTAERILQLLLLGRLGLLAAGLRGCACC